MKTVLLSVSLPPVIVKIEVPDECDTLDKIVTGREEEIEDKYSAETQTFIPEGSDLYVKLYTKEIPNE